MVQTYTPDHPSISLAATHDYLRFAELELVHRKEHQYPPYQRLVRLIVRSQDEGAAMTFAETLAEGAGVSEVEPNSTATQEITAVGEELWARAGAWPTG